MAACAEGGGAAPAPRPAALPRLPSLRLTAPGAALAASAAGEQEPPSPSPRVLRSSTAFEPDPVPPPPLLDLNSGGLDLNGGGLYGMSLLEPASKTASKPQRKRASFAEALEVRSAVVRTSVHVHASTADASAQAVSLYSSDSPKHAAKQPTAADVFAADREDADQQQRAAAEAQ